MKSEFKSPSFYISVLAIVISILTAWDSASPNINVEVLGLSSIESELKVCRSPNFQSIDGVEYDVRLSSGFPGFAVLYLVSNAGGRKVTLTDVYADVMQSADINNKLHGFLYDASDNGSNFYSATNFEVEYADVTSSFSHRVWWIFDTRTETTVYNVPIALEPGDAKKIGIWFSTSINVSEEQLDKLMASHLDPSYDGNHMDLPITLAFSDGSIFRDTLEIGISQKSEWVKEKEC